MLFVISLPMWLAALWMMAVGLYGFFGLGGGYSLTSVLFFGSSSLMAFLAARICGWA